jgi:hypothetical protein
VGYVGVVYTRQGCVVCITQVCPASLGDCMPSSCITTTVWLLVWWLPSPHCVLQAEAAAVQVEGGLVGCPCSLLVWQAVLRVWRLHVPFRLCNAADVLCSICRLGQGSTLKGYTTPRLNYPAREAQQQRVEADSIKHGRTSVRSDETSQSSC